MTTRTIRVLLVEDNPGDARLIREYLIDAGSGGFKMEAVRTLAAALEKLSRPGIDVVLLDLGLPDSAGIETLKAVRSHAPDPLAVVVITGLDDEEIAVQAVQAGAQDYLVKGEISGVLLARALRYAVERKRAEEALRQSEERFRSLFEQAADIILLLEITPEGIPVIRQANSATVRLLGYGQDELIGRPVSCIDAAPDVSKAVGERRRNVLSGIGKIFEARHRCKDGTVRDFECSVTEMQIGSKTFAISVERDITERKRTEGRLQLMADMLDAAPTSVMVHDADGHILYGNSKAFELHGYSSEEFLRLNLRDLLPADAQTLLSTRIRQIQETGHAPFEVSHLRKDGSAFPLHVHARTAEWEGKPVILSVQTDLTERTHLEDQLRQAMKMEVVGRLAGGVAHDFNNILMVISGYAQLILEEISSDNPIRPQIEEIRKAGDRAAALTRQLLILSRKNVIHPHDLVINDTVVGIAKMLRRVIGEDVELETRLAPDLRHILADPSQIEQILLNLATNARDAMPDGGRLIIETADIDLDDAYARLHVEARTGRHVMLAITDTGSGMSTETLKHLFEPFFTTKASGKGTGLGSSMVYSTVKKCGGHINVYSEPGRGSTFKIFFPAAEGAGKPLPPAASAVENYTQGTGVILVAEDEAAVRDIVRKTLADSGYTVLAASCGEEALATSEDRDGPIDLLVTDMVMPGIDGFDLFKRLSAERPGIKVIFMSGYTDRAFPDILESSGSVGFIQKPFEVKTFRRVVAEMLAKPARPRSG
jgi:two-component system, cell cycle sensor histidine kinase and response regulator CckA